jgi:hypothetical protein
MVDMSKFSMAPVHAPYPAAHEWLRNIAKGDSVDVAYAPVITEQSFEPGDQELREVWPEGAHLGWFGGPAAAPLEGWPRNSNGEPLAHVIALDLAMVDGTAHPDDKATWPDLREGLPKTGVLEVFHDLQSFGFEAEDKPNGGWVVRWIPEPDRSVLIDAPTDLDTPSEVCQVALTMPGYTIPGAHNYVDSDKKLFKQVEKAGSDLQRTWMHQRQITDLSEPIPYSHVYGHPDRNRALAVGVLENVLPLDDGDQYRLILDIESWTFLEGWFGDAGNLEVWMRQSDLDAQRFSEAWCLIRTD